MNERIVVDQWLTIDAAEIEWRFSPSGGPGGQHANRAHTRVEARYDISASPTLDDATRHRLVARLGPTIRVVADEHRSQLRNRQEARDRLVAMLAAANHVPRRRRPTRPSASQRQRRLNTKREDSERKARRRRPAPDD